MGNCCDFDGGFAAGRIEYAGDGGRAVPSALRAVTSLAEGGEEKRIPTPVCGLARNDMGRAMWTPSPTKSQGARAMGGRGVRTGGKRRCPFGQRL